MAFATDAERRQALANNPEIKFALRVTNKDAGRQGELFAESFSDLHDMSVHWRTRANKVELFRVYPEGILGPHIGRILGTDYADALV